MAARFDFFRVRIWDQDISDCVLVTGDGTYHREHSEEQINFSSTHMEVRNSHHIFEGKLSESELNELSGLLNKEEFRALREPKKLQPAHRFLEVWVVRPNGESQKFIFSEDGDFKPNQQVLKPLFSWTREMWKRKHDVSKAPANNCMPTILK